MRVKLLALAAAGALAALAGSGPGHAFQPAGGACTVNLPAEADGESFEMAGRAEGAAQAALVQQTGRNFAQAAARLCTARGLTAAHLRPYRKLLVRNAEAATEPTVSDVSIGRRATRPSRMSLATAPSEMIQIASCARI